MTTPDRPLVTFALFAYNQEKYIREAIEGAFSQTYQPLEIILSDDCSSDRTFEIMQEMAAAYQGPHKIILNKNYINFGIGRHVSRVAALTNGELIVLAAGDDVSYPKRTRYIVESWLSSNRKALAFESLFRKIDKQSQDIGTTEYFRLKNAQINLSNFCERNEFLFGATTAYHVSVFSSFPPLLNGIVHEDRVLPFRALLLGGEIAQISNCLVDYRIDSGISANYKIRGKQDSLVFSQRLLFDFIQKSVDALHIGRDDLVHILSNGIARYSAEVYMLTGQGSIQKSFQLACSVGIRWGFRSLLKRAFQNR